MLWLTIMTVPLLIYFYRDTIKDQLHYITANLKARVSSADQMEQETVNDKSVRTFNPNVY
jgi:hypothetical protein